MKNQQSDGASGQLELFARHKSEIPDAERLQTLQEKLYQKAKQEPDSNRKSQMNSRLHGQQAFEKLVKRYKLTDPIKYKP